MGHEWPAMKKPLWLLYFVVLAAVGLLQLFGTDIWAGSIPDPGPWCEADRPSAFLREPSNALSDFAYLWLGFWFLSNAWSDAHQTAAGLGVLAVQPTVGVIGALANCGHFLGSFVNHACRCHTGHVLDVFGMYAAIWFLTSLAFSQWQGLNVRSFSILYVCPLPLCWICSQFYYSDPAREPMENGVVTTMVVLIAVCFYRLGISKDTIGKILLLMLFGKVAQELDIRRIYCEPSSMIQGHAVWHVATAIVMQLVVLELRKGIVKHH